MICKIISCSSFAGIIDYVINRHHPKGGGSHRAVLAVGEASVDQAKQGNKLCRILAAESITPPNALDMARDFKDQTLLNPRLKNTVDHISLSFSRMDADKLTDIKITGIAKKYMERRASGIRSCCWFGIPIRHIYIVSSSTTVSAIMGKLFPTSI